MTDPAVIAVAHDLRTVIVRAEGSGAEDGKENRTEKRKANCLN